MPSNFDELFRAVKRQGVKDDNQIGAPPIEMMGAPQMINLSEIHTSGGKTSGKKNKRKKSRKETPNPYLKGINELNPSSLTKEEKKELFRLASKAGNEDATHKVNALFKKGDREIYEVSSEYWVDAYDRYSEMENSTMIHSKDYQPMNCVICGAHMPTIHHTHNPHPYTSACIAKDALLNHREDRCCSKCDKEIVLPLRMKTGNANDSAYYKKWEENPNGGGE